MLREERGERERERERRERERERERMHDKPRTATFCVFVKK